MVGCCIDGYKPLAYTVSSDYNFVRDGNKCVAAGPEPIPAGVCQTLEQKYLGSSGYRKIPGNTCIGGSKDEKVEKPCSNGIFVFLL
jgi:hypothetical protein